EIEVAAALAGVGLDLPDAGPNADDLAVVDKQVRNRDGAAKESAGVEAEVKDEAFEALALQLGKGSAQVALGVACKAVEANVGDARLGIEPEIPAVVRLAARAHDGFQLDVGPRDIQLEGFRKTLAFNREADAGVGFAQHLLDGVRKGHAARGKDFRLRQRVAFAVHL